jgi:protein TonB
MATGRGWLVGVSATLGEKSSHLQPKIYQGIIRAVGPSISKVSSARTAVFAEDHSRLYVAATIAAVHALGLYVAFTFAPQISQAVAQVPLTATFVSQPEPTPRWELPQVAVVTPQPIVQMPDLPMIDIPTDAAPSARAITVPMQAPSPPAMQAADRSTPKLVSTVEYVREPSPRYPPQSRRLREQGLVVLRVVIDERGEASSIEIETSSGHARLDDAARDAVLRAAFRPYVEDGEPRRALVLIPIEFALNRGSA